MIHLTYEDGPLLVRALEVLIQGTNQPLQLQALDIIKQVQDQLQYPNVNGDLIDLIAEALAQPDCRNVLNGDVLHHLRRVILTPGEMDTVRAMLKTARGCAGCGTPIEDEELLTAGAASTWTCAFCSLPIIVNCCGCGKTKVEMPGSIRKRLRGIRCPTCTEAHKANAAQAAAEPPPPPPAEPVFLEDLQFMGRQAEWLRHEDEYR